MAPSTHGSLLFLLLSCLMMPVAADNVFSNGLVYLPIYLGIASLANLLLAWRAWQTLRQGFPSECVGLLILMMTGVAWYLVHMA